MLPPFSLPGMGNAIQSNPLDFMDRECKTQRGKGPCPRPPAGLRPAGLEAALPLLSQVSKLSTLGPADPNRSSSSVACQQGNLGQHMNSLGCSFLGHWDTTRKVLNSVPASQSELRSGAYTY